MIAKYRKTVVAPTFNGIQKWAKSRETKQMQFWFCPKKLQACVKETRSRSIVHYPTLPLVWPIKFERTWLRQRLMALRLLCLFSPLM